MLDSIIIAKLLKQRQKMAESAHIRTFKLKGFSLSYPSLMGVINLSPDSAYKESICTDTTTAIARGRTLHQQGAVIVDIGAESTLGDAQRVSAKAQLELLLPVVKVLASEGILISVESYHPEVLEAVAIAGAAVFNLTGTIDETAVYRIATKYDTAVIHSYIQGEHVRQVSDFKFLSQLEIAEWFKKRLQLAKKQGLQKNILDAGLGFYYPNLKDSSQRVHHQLDTLLNAWQLHSLGSPIMNILPHAPEAFVDSLRSHAEPFFAVFALIGGTHIVRTHEVATVNAVKHALEMY